MKRTTMIRSAAVLVTALTLTACAGGGSGEGGTVTYTSYGGVAEEAITKAWLEPFAEETGIEVVTDSPTEYSRVQQMVETGQVIWDVVQAGEDIGVRSNSDLLTEIDCTVVDCKSFEDGLFPVEKYGMPVLVFSVVMTYNTDVFKGNEPTTWADFFDVEKFPGKRAIYGKAVTGGLNGILEIALIQDGVPIDDLYPLDVERALAKLDTIKDDLIIYNDFSECTTLVATGEAVMGNCYNGRVNIAAEEGQPVGLSWSNQVQFADYLVIPKGAPNTENAMKLLAYIGANENNGRLGEFIAYGPPNPNAAVDPSAADRLPTANDMEGDDRPIKIDQGGWWAENSETLGARWADWKAS
ncbi:ABC transporter substrate-binding protein [Microbacterium maritypicum]|uniref:ABC transporter substrate-binding protein n=1 Tax=Microbacterium maritypicum TaxID=33918 RepID=UPI001B31C610|nr:ABC transporter substrate-binding protein [Microbacterium liquefaciens]MBP5801303.1 ABC transporter substrate-binding protein [Microbacterium liquefaciens]